MPVRRWAVIGGGWAGMAAAVEARLRGAEPTLFEMAPQWGGRARRVDIDGLAFDNGQHILIGAYSDTLRLMQVVGVSPDEAFVRMPLRLTTPDGHGLALPAGSPLIAFTRGVLAQRAWPLADRLSLLSTAAGWALRRFRCDDATSVAQLTRRLPALLREELIEPLCVAALNTPARDASGRVFLRVLRDALFSGPGSADLLLPKQRLSELLPHPAARWLSENGGTLRLGTRVERIDAVDSGWRIDGQHFDAVVLATTAVEAARLVRPFAPDWAAGAAALQYEPIVTVYAQSAGTRLPQPVFALPSDEQDRPAQFVFDHGQLGGPEGLLAFVISGAGPWMERGGDQTRDATLRQGHAALAAHLRSPLRGLRVLAERRATFRCTPGLQRPPGAIAPGLHAAGDYVAGPYPATLEGAVRSAVQAVAALAASA